MPSTIENEMRYALYSHETIGFDREVRLCIRETTKMILSNFIER